MFKLSTLAPIVLATLLAACGSQEAPAPKAEAPAPAAEPAAPPPAPVADATPAAAPAAEPASDAAMAGESIYKRTCALCHSAGVAGAPMLGDAADWGPRIAQGKDTLYKHALEGFTGAKGMMPAKGGNAALTDDEVKSVVDYMVLKAG
ncbi:c-type cytochrome [Cognatazoarcus halotolerans]|uniref:c-type cytochrome n=1 Tax=Cognatazoarcus halotolerans TaxID=2686016 RepID=UPI00135B9DCC|nr:c-type cytochrome [Cognatazoarcus halotolerans]